jgi:protein-S-isoprenylcysteine O-methyltransferase Ste14
VKWRWSNVPVPEACVVGLVLGAILQRLFPARIMPIGWIGHALGWPLIGVGVGLALWAVRAAREMDISTPDTLLTEGPYAISRNPMYVGWILIYMGIALVTNSLWILALLAPVAAYIHFVDVLGEERALEQEFGEAYRAYRQRVRRYL